MTQETYSNQNQQQQPARPWEESGLIFHEIATLDDPVYDSWLDLYQQSFPLDEQILVSQHNKPLRDGSGLEHFVAALDAQGRLIAMARYDHIGAINVGVLWYLAVRTEDRSKGIGSMLYQEIWRRAQVQKPATRAMFIEVEDPKAARSPDQKRDAERRIAFYERNGAGPIDGIQYEQSVGWQPAIPMRLMIHVRSRMEPIDVLEAAKALFGSDVTMGHALSIRLHYDFKVRL